MEIDRFALLNIVQEFAKLLLALLFCAYGATFDVLMKRTYMKDSERYPKKTGYYE